MKKLNRCGQIIDGVQEFCDACWECSSLCSECDEWFDKEQVSPLSGFCSGCILEREHEFECENGHIFTVRGIPAQCPTCCMFSISPTTDDPALWGLIAKAQEKAIAKMEAMPMESLRILQTMGVL